MKRTSRSASLLIFLCAACEVSLLAADRNIVLVVTDDQSPDAGCYGNEVLQTPNLDALAADGIRFDQAYCTTASCSASRSVILSGLHNHATAQYGHQHGYHHFRTYERIQTLPVRLKAAGYRTARVGKFHVGPEEAYRFDQALSGSGRSPVEMAENCRDFVSAPDDHPFFLYYCTSDPHRSGGVDNSSPHKPNRFGNRPEGYRGVTEMTYSPSEVHVHEFLPDTPVCRAELAQYYQSVSRVDQGLGRLVDILKQADAYDNTLIVFTSDHGIAFPGGKTTLYDGGMHIPLVVRAPSQEKRGIQTTAMVSLVDVTPTLLDFAGVWEGGEAEFHGRSFLGILEPGQSNGWDEVHASHTFHEITMYYPMRVVRTRDHKLIWNIAHALPYPFASDLWAAPTWQDIFRQGPDALYGKRTVDQYIHRAEFELYDLNEDPDEVVNLADDPRHAELLATLKQKLKTFQDETDDPWILKWDYE